MLKILGQCSKLLIGRSTPDHYKVMKTSKEVKRREENKIEWSRTINDETKSDDLTCGFSLKQQSPIEQVARTHLSLRSSTNPSYS